MKHRHLTALAVLLAIPLACERSSQITDAPTVDTDENAEPPPVLDQFSGKTVIDEDHARGLMMSRLENAPVAGESAPDGELVDAMSGASVRLSSLWKERPIVLVFGSASCSSLNFHRDSVDALAGQYQAEADFFFIYIREAHPDGGFQPILMGDLTREHSPRVTDSNTIENRRELAQNLGESKLGNLRHLVDPLDDRLAVQWGAWPARIFVVDPSGKVVYAGDQGPWYFRVTKDSRQGPPPTEIEEQLRKRPHDRSSLQAFLESRFGEPGPK